LAHIDKRTTSTGENRYDVRYRDPAGKPRKRTFRRLEDARGLVRTVEADMARGEWIDPARGRETFGDYAAAWLKSADVKPSTRSGYASVLNKHLLPRWRDTPMAAISTVDVESWLAELRDSGRAPSTVRNVRNAMSAVCRFAVRSGAIRSNPIADVKAAKGRGRREMRFLTAEQIADLAEAIDPRYRLAVLTTAYTGLRAGELAALKVGRVDVLRRRLTVAESTAEVHGALVTTSPKNGRTRTVPLPRFLADQLAEHLAPIATDPDAYVFTAPKGGQIRHSLFYDRYFKPAAAAIGHPDLRWHDLRHTAVSLMIASGATPLVISRAIGHGSIAVTYDVYGHVLPHHDDELADALDAIHAAASPSRAAVVSPLGTPS
jgi:integrase